MTTEQNARCEQLDGLQRIVAAVAVTLGLEVWEDGLRGDSDAILENLQRALNGRDLKNFLRGVRAANAMNGLDPDVIPEEGLS